jgi:hypothetical protein
MFGFKKSKGLVCEDAFGDQEEIDPSAIRTLDGARLTYSCMEEEIDG